MKCNENSKWQLFTLIAFTLATSLLLRPASAADEAQPKSNLITDGQLDLQFRYRYEFVEQDGFLKDAHASTLRTRLAYRSPTLFNFGLLLEFDDMRPIGNDLYNSTRNGNTNRPTVADPKGTLVNQALILYKGIDNTVIHVGRRRITLDNHRFIGDVVWRQNDQTYDGVSISNTSLPDTRIEYAYINKVNRIFGPDSGTPPADFQSDSHVLNLNYNWLPDWNLTAYAYLLDFDDSPTRSNQTFGIRALGNVDINEKLTTSYTLEYAHQSDYGAYPGSYSADYFLLEGALTTAGVTGKLGYEVLGGGSVQAFQTPLATLHALQGWADKFLSTPLEGIEDLYASVATKFYGANVALVYHRFEPDRAGPAYGTELDLVIKKPVGEHYSIIFKYADYNSRSFATDTKKIWLMMSANFGS